MQLRWRIAQFCELLWWRFYLARKPKKEYLAWKQAYWTAFLKNIEIAIPAGASVLDAGCGPAGIFIILDRQIVHAVDPLIHKYRTSFVHFSPADYPWVQFFNQPLETFEPTIKYDVVLALNAINHVEQLDICLDRLVALTKPGGHLFLSVDAHRYRGLRYFFKILPADILHPHQYTLKQYQAMLHQRGLPDLQTQLLRQQGIFSYFLLAAQLPPVNGQD